MCVATEAELCAPTSLLKCLRRTGINARPLSFVREMEGTLAKSYFCKVYLFWEKEWGRERDRESEAGSAVSQTWGSISSLWDHDLSGNQELEA